MPYTLLLFAFPALLALVPGVWAQTAPAVCNPTVPWANNSKGQNPCLVASYLQSVCNGGTWNVPALAEGQFYTGPRIDDANACVCSSVTYNLLSECELCQSRSILPWSTYKTNCSDVLISIATWREAIPTGTAIPAWAFVDPSGRDAFSEADAALLASKPDVTAISSASPTPFPMSVSATSSPSVNIGAIVGGVVGGVVALGLIVGAAFYVLRLLKRRTSQLSPSQQYMKQPVYGLSPTAPPRFGAASNASRPGRSGTVRHNQTSSREHRSTHAPRENRSTHAPREQRSYNDVSKSTTPYQSSMGHLPQQPYDPVDHSAYPPSSKGSFSQGSHGYSNSNTTSPSPQTYNLNPSPYGQYNNQKPRQPPVGYYQGMGEI